MRKKALFYLSSLISLFCLFLSSASAFEINSEQPGFNNKKNSLTILFLPLHYGLRDDFSKDRSLIVKRLYSTTPFKGEEDKIRIGDIVISDSETRKYIKNKDSFPGVEVDEYLLNKIYLRLKSNFKLVIIDTQNKSCAAQFSQPGITSVIVLGRVNFNNEENLGKGFLHELGHSLGLREERPIGASAVSQAGYPNCASTKEEAQKWWGDLVGKDERVNYIPGCCGNTSYYRPTINSLMNDINKAEDFGPVNERYLRKALDR